MDNNEQPARTKKLKFKPKPPTKKPTLKRATPSRSDSETAAAINQLSRRLSEKHGRNEAKVEKTSLEQDSFGHGATSMDSIKRNSAPTSGTSGKSSGSMKNEAISGRTEKPITIPSAVEADGTVFSSTDDEEEYKEPFDYRSNYPITLPMRPPNSGDPALLDKVEFGDDSINMHPIEVEEYKDPDTNPALEFGLQGECKEDKMFLVQLPITMPFLNQPSAKGNERETSKQGCKFEDLSSGVMGKMLVYKSGAVKFKVGKGDDVTLFDVDSGVDNTMPVEAVAINTEQKHYCVLGDLQKHKMIVKLNIDK